MKERLSFKLFRFLFLFVLISALVVIAAGPGEAIKVPGVSGDAIKIGMIFDQTGPTVTVQGPIAEAAKTYFKYINDLVLKLDYIKYLKE